MTVSVPLWPTAVPTSSLPSSRRARLTAGFCRVRNGQDGAERAVALDLHRDACAVILEGIAHHRTSRERAAKRRRGDGRGVVDLAGALGQTARVDRDSVDKAIFRDGADQTVLLCFHIWFLTF